MPKIFEKLKKMDRNIIIYNQSKKILNISLIIIKQIYSLIFKKKIIHNDFFMIPSLNFEKIKIIDYKAEYKNSLIEKEYLLNTLKDIEYYINLNKGYKIYNKSYLKIF